MTPDWNEEGNAQRPMHPALRSLTTFVIGALFGAVGVFFFVTLHPPMTPSAAPCPPAPATGVSAQADVPAMRAETVASRVVSPPPVAPVIDPAPASSQSAVAQQAAASHAQIESPPPASAAASIATPGSSSPSERPSASLLIPVAGINVNQLTDTFTDARSAGRRHDAIDIMAPRGSQVLAVDDGKVAKLFYSKLGGITLYAFDPTEKFVYYYAHLDSYAPGIIEGKQLHRGDLLGFVGSTGDANAAAPHLHFAISVLGPEKHWWQATAINPYPLLSRR